MPIREYKCSECGCEFESIELGERSGSKSGNGMCPMCGSSDIGRKFSLFSSPRGEAGPSCEGNKPAPGRFG